MYIPFHLSQADKLNADYTLSPAAAASKSLYVCSHHLIKRQGTRICADGFPLASLDTLTQGSLHGH